MTTKPLRFAPIIRVSTEGQEQRGESLRTQRTQIVANVNALGGVVPPACWEYSGQEHATPDMERAKLDKLLADAERDVFDAVIVCDASRWSRDNLKSKQGLNILRENKIRFFVATTEFDLYDPAAMLFLGMSAEIGEFQAREQARKSLLNRIARARRGIPSVSKRPFGRTYNRETGRWSVIPDKQQIVTQAAARYLAGESFVAVAKSYDMHPEHLWKVINHRSGDQWHVSFNSQKLNISERITITIPRLLPEATIQAVRQRAAANRTYNHGAIKNKYLLSRMIFCDVCGYALSGDTSRHMRRYYKHRNMSQRVRACSYHKHIEADHIERTVLFMLASTLGDSRRLERAIAAATPDYAEIAEIRKELTQLSKHLVKLTHQRERLVVAVSKGLLRDSDISRRMAEIQEAEALTRQRQSALNDVLGRLPNPDDVKKIASFQGKVWYGMSRDNPRWILREPYDVQRQFLQAAFAGTDAQGRRHGVYVHYNEATSQWEFQIRGLINTELLTLPLDSTTIEEMLNLDPDYDNVKEEVQAFREGLSNQPYPTKGSDPATSS